MATPAGIPTPPTSPDLNQMHKYMLSLHIWLKSMLLNGSQAVPFSQAQLDEMVSSNDLTQAGKFFFNSDTQQLNAANVVAGTLTIVAIT